mgnify:CR=1 FL=1
MPPTMNIDEREPQVQRPDVLVVGRCDPAHDPRRMVRVTVRVVVRCGLIVGNAAHRLLPNVAAYSGVCRIPSFPRTRESIFVILCSMDSRPGRGRSKLSRR